MKIYEHIEIPEDKRILVFGDIHGAFELTEKAFYDLGITDDDIKIFVGDLIDRGPHNYKSVLRGMREPNTYCIRGNHEDMFIKGILEGSREHYQCWYMNGGAALYDEMVTDEALSALAVILEEAPVMLSVNHGDKKYGFVHAEYPSIAEHIPFQELEQVMIANKAVARVTEMLMWNRDLIDCIKEGMTIKPVLGVDAVFHGHTPVATPFKHGNRHFIDSGGVFNGNLSVAVIETGKDIWYYSTKD